MKWLLLLFFVLLVGEAYAQPPPKATVKIEREGTGPAAKKGDRVTVRYKGTQGWSGVVDTEGTTPKAVILGSIEAVPRHLFDHLAGMQEGEKRVVNVPKELIDQSYHDSGRISRWNGDVKYEVELVKLQPAPTEPKPPEPWSIKVEGTSWRATISSEGGVITSLEYKWRDKWLALIDVSKLDVGAGWLGAAYAGKDIKFLQCERSYTRSSYSYSSDVTYAPVTPLATHSVSRAGSTLSLCSWQPGKMDRHEFEWKPRIGAMILAFEMKDEPPSIRISATSDRRWDEDSVDYSGQSNFGFAGYKNSSNLVPGSQAVAKCMSESNLYGSGHEAGCMGAALFVSVHTGGKAGFDSYGEAARLHFGLRTDADPLTPLYSKLRANNISFFPFRIVGWLMELPANLLGTELGLIVFGVVVATSFRLLSYKDRSEALKSRTSSPWEKLETGGKVVVVVILGVIAGITLYIYNASLVLQANAQWFDVTSEGTYPVAIGAAAALMVAFWAILGKKTLSGEVGAILLRLAFAVPALWLAAKGPWVLVPTGAMFGWAASDVVVRLGATRSLFAKSGEEMKDALVARLRADQTTSGWNALAKEVDDALRHAQKPDELAVFAAVLAHAGEGTKAIKTLGDLPASALEPGSLRYAALAIALAHDSSPRGRELVQAALEVPPINDGIEADLRAAIAKAFPPSMVSDRMPRAAEAAQRTRPDWTWGLEAQAMALLAAGKAKEAAATLSQMAVQNPQVLAGREETVADAVIAAGGAMQIINALLGQLLQEGPERQAAHLAILDAIVSAGTPLHPQASGTLRQLAGRHAPALMARLLLAAGDASSALQAARAGEKNEETAWLETRAALATEDARAIAEVLRHEEHAAAAEIALALDDREKLAKLLHSLSPSSRGRRLLVARVCLALGDHARAVDVLASMPQGSAEAGVLLARAALQSGREREAVKALGNWSSQLPFWKEALYRLGCAQAHAGDTQSAAGTLQAARQDGDRRAALALAELARRVGDAQTSRQVVQEILQSGTGHPALLRGACVAAVAIGPPDLARAALERLRAVAPQAPSVGMLEGAIHEMQGATDAARAAYARAGAWGRLLVLAAAHGDTAAAAEALERIADRDLERTTSRAILSAVAACAQQRDDLGKADRALCLLLGLAPSDATTRRELADLRMARASRAVDEGGGLTAARELLEDALRRTGDPRVLRALNEIDLAGARSAIMSGTTEDRARALTVMQAMRKRAPDDPRAPLFESALQIAAGQIEAAGRALKGLERNVWAGFLYGLALSRAGKRVEAAAVLSNTVSADPDPKLATAAWLAAVAHDVDGQVLGDLASLAGRSP